MDNGVQPRPNLAVRDLSKHQIVEAGVEKSGKVDQNIQRTATLAGLDLRQMDGADIQPLRQLFLRQSLMYEKGGATYPPLSGVDGLPYEIPLP